MINDTVAGQIRIPTHAIQHEDGRRLHALPVTAQAGGRRIHDDQAGKLQFRAGVSPTTLTYKDGGLTSRVTYSYRVTAWTDCNGNGTSDMGVDLESPVRNLASATAQ